jgi:hypothetical protein
MEERINQHESEISELKHILSSHIDDENHQVLELRRDLNGNLIKIHAALLRIEPVVKKYEDGQIINENIKNVGDHIIWWGRIVIGSGAIYAVIKYFFIK